MSAAIKKAESDQVGVLVNANGITPLMDAVCDDSIDTVRTLLDSGVDVNAKREDGFTALLLAAFFGRTEIVELLLERGADIHAKTRFGTSALMWATARGFPKIVNVLQKAETRTIVEARKLRVAEEKSCSESQPSRILPEIVDPPPVTADAFHPGQVFVARVTSSPKTLAALAAVVIVVVGFGIFATYRITATRSEHTTQTPPTANELTMESNIPAEQPAFQEPDQQQAREPAESPLYSNHTVKPSIKTFSDPTPVRSSVSRQRQDTARREVQHEESEVDSKPAPITVEVSREQRPAPPATTNAEDIPRTQPAPMGITSSKPQSKVIQWP